MAKITTKQLAHYAADQLQHGVTGKQVSLHIAALLVSERRSKDALAFARALEVELDSRGLTQVTITSAHEVSEAIKREVAHHLNAKNPTYTTVIDPTVIGGLKASTLHAQIDITIQGQLQSFKRKVNEDN